MNTPTLRFKEFSGAWEVKTLGKICDVRDGTHESPKYHPNGFPFITSKNLLSNGGIDFENVSLISEIDFNNLIVPTNQCR
jgi:type I restriction enzyme S subunit